MNHQTTVINLFAGPGVGKSTTAALVFGMLKQRGVSIELAHEYAKDLTWENRKEALAYQPYIMAKQSWHIQRLMGKVDFVLTDSPLPLCAVYAGLGYTEGLESHIKETFFGWSTLNILLERDETSHPYVQEGRRQTLEEAKRVDRDIADLLYDWNILYERVSMADNAAEEIVDLICEDVDDDLLKLVKELENLPSRDSFRGPDTGGFISCDCPCHLPIEQGGGAAGDCDHCRVLG